jgi:5-methylcytosine-specific restriction protein A
MKLMNFHHFNPNHPGEGLSRGSKQDEEVFLEFQNDLDNLNNISNLIIKHLESDEPIEVPDLDDDEFESQEGKLLTKVHRSRERNRTIIKKKKDKVLKETGRLQCEGCGFDFSETYGKHGQGFIECHHLKPVSEIVSGEKTKLNDLSLVCSNCHRMIHHQKPWLSIEQLKSILT